MTEKIRTVLVADDDPDIRALLTLNLEMHGYEVLVAENGGEARAMATSMLPDVIVLDVMMPVFDGFDILHALKADEATQRIPVVMLTAKASDKDVWAGWQAGVDYYVTKPFDPDDVLVFIEHLADPENHPLPC